MEKHFVTFYSAGALVPEQTTKEIEDWCTVKACEMARKIKERHNSRPYGFRFITRKRTSNMFEPKVSDTSNMYFIDCEKLSLQDIIDRKDPKDDILIRNMENNKLEYIAQTKSGWKWCQQIKKDDIVLDFEYA